MKKLLMIPALAVLVVACNPKNAEEAETGEAKKSGEMAGTVMTAEVDNSTLRWRGVKPTGEHYGTVGISEGKVAVNDGDVTGGSITIDMNTIVCEDLEGDRSARLVDHLKSEDFFYTEEYPTAKFDIISLDPVAGASMAGGIVPTHEVTGNLAMRKVTKSITFPAVISVADDKVTAMTNEFSIDRTLWGVNYKSKKVFAELKDDFINDMINLQFNVIFSAE